MSRSPRTAIQNANGRFKTCSPKPPIPRGAPSLILVLFHVGAVLLVIAHPVARPVFSDSILLVLLSQCTHAAAALSADSVHSCCCSLSALVLLLSECTHAAALSVHSCCCPLSARMLLLFCSHAAAALSLTGGRRVFVGLCAQYDTEGHEDDNCFEADAGEWQSHVRTAKLHWREARGPPPRDQRN